VASERGCSFVLSRRPTAAGSSSRITQLGRRARDSCVRGAGAGLLQVIAVNPPGSGRAAWLAICESARAIEGASHSPVNRFCDFEPGFIVGVMLVAGSE